MDSNNAGSRTVDTHYISKPCYSQYVILDIIVITVNITLLLTVLKSKFGGVFETKVFLAS